MNMRWNQPLHLPLLVGGITAILVSGIAIGSLAISASDFDGIVASAESRDMAPAPAQAQAKAVLAPAIAAPRARPYRCAECGVIESTRKVGVADEKAGVNAPGRIAAGNRGAVEATSARNHEITVRLRDGSKRVFTDANPGRWRHGERVTIIAGVN